MIRITADIFIDENEITEEFTRAGGPGGQHVNKVSTAVKLRFDIGASKLPGGVKERLTGLGGSRVTGDGVLIISSRGSRSRELNRTDALQKLIELIKKASERPKQRVPTKTPRAKKEARLAEKKVRGGTKRLRGKVEEED